MLNRIFIACSLTIAIGCSPNENEENSKSFETWEVYHGDATASSYSSLNLINKENVSKLEVAWTFNCGDQDERSQIQCSPIIVEDVMYATSPQMKLFAIKANNGEEKWAFDPFKGKQAQGVSRGCAYWKKGDDERIFYIAGSILYALDARSGEKISSFGNHGKVDLHDGLDRDVSSYDVVSTSPGIIYKDLFIMGSRVSESERAAPGHVRAYNVLTGKREWIFHTIPHPGEFGYDTWPEEAWKESGGANAWSGFSLDHERGIVYMPTGSPSFDFHGGNRHGDNLYGNSLIALNAATGERIWHFQTVHHDVWDRDLPCQPNLVTVNHDGKKIDAVAQVTKHGVTFLFDRETGEPLFPIEEKEVPTTNLLNEKTSLTQPYPLKPEPFSRQTFSKDIINDILPGSKEYILNKIEGARYGHKFMPPSQEGTVVYPGYDGGADWGGAAVDPTSGMLYINASEMTWLLHMIPKSGGGNALETPGQKVYMANCAACHGADKAGQQHVFPSLVGIKDRLTKKEAVEFIEKGKGRMPGFGHVPEEDRKALVDYLYEEEKKDSGEGATGISSDEAIPYTFGGYRKLLDENGYPAVKPPWGTLNAINLNTGEIEWKVPLGELKELTEKGIPPTGTESYGGPIATAGGLIFIGGSKDEKFRAFHKDTGDILWEYQLPAGGYATPATYQIDGRQYVVIAAGGGKLGTKSGDAYIAFSLPH
ncbi:MAG: pyrroloquinoline quinone-dependent dehydrogenase [Cyclobacteriaceae bacterium]